MRRVEDTLRDALLLAIPHEIEGAIAEPLDDDGPSARGWYRNIIDRHVQDPKTKREYQLKSGSKGMADVFIYVPAEPWAIPIEVELKSYEGRQEPEQKRWQTLMTSSKVPFLLLRQKKAETTAETVDRWIQEIKLLIAILLRTPWSSTPPSMHQSTAYPSARHTTAPTPETQNDSSNGSEPISDTFRSGTSGLRGIDRVGRRARSARLRLPFKPPA